jgi:hypothetical protein
MPGASAVSFLNQLKSQANALQSEQDAQKTRNEAHAQATEAAAKTVWLYLSELAKQLNVITPAAPSLSLDGKNIWPAMKLVDFRVDARKKRLRDKEVHDYIAMAWRLVPSAGAPLATSVSANFPPDLQRIETRLAAGSVKHERVNVRHPEKNTLQAIRFDHVTEARGSITVTLDHDNAKLLFRLAALQGFAITNTEYPASQVQTPLLDELAKLMVGQPGRFV